MSALIDGLPLVYLKPGETHFSQQRSVVVTVLGSCLSVTLFSRRRGIGGICHGLLPQCGRQRDCGKACGEEGKYVACSIRGMARLFDRHGAKRSEIEVKCFGGAEMFTREPAIPGIVSVGRQNITTAEQILESEGLKPMAVDVGGLLGRKLYFYTHTGDVLLKRLKARGMAAG